MFPGVSALNTEDIPTDFLAFTDSIRKDVFLMAINGGPQIPLGAANQINPVAITYNHMVQSLYWTDRKYDELQLPKAIWKFNLHSKVYSSIVLPPGNLYAECK